MSVIDNAQTAITEARAWMQSHRTHHSARRSDVKALSAALDDLIPECERATERAVTAEMNLREMTVRAARFAESMQDLASEMHQRELHHFETEQLLTEAGIDPDSQHPSIE